MSDDGTSFTIDLPVTGAPAIDAAAASIDSLAVRLDAASKASIAASAAMSAGEASYRTSEAAADRAAKALERIGVAADAQRGKLQEAMDTGDVSGADRAAEKLRNLMDRQAEAASKALAAKTALEAEATALDKLKAAAEAAATEEDKLSQESDKASTSEKSASEGIHFEGAERGLNKLGGPLGAVGSKIAGLASGWGKVSKAFGDLGPEVIAAVGVAAVAAAVAAVTVAAISGVVSLAQWAVGLADANRNALLLSQGIARSVAGGAALNDKLNALTTTLPLTREELSGMAQRLADSGLRGNALTAALDKSAMAAAKLKFGPDFAKEMLSLDQQTKVFHANIAAVFGGLKTDALMGALQKLVGLFDANSASGKALKVVFESIMQPLIDKVTAAEPMIERFFLQLEIWALKALIAIKPYGSTFIKIGEALLVVAAIIGGVLVVALGLLVLPFAVAIAATTALVLGVEWAVGKLIAGFSAVKGWLANFSLADVGKAMIDGLINGIIGGGAALLASVKGVVTGAVDAAKKALGIASPSKVFAEIGMQTGAGMSQGVDRSSAGVQDSLESMVAPPSPSGGAAPSTAPAASSVKSGSGTSLAGATFNLYGVQGAEDAEARISALLTRILEGDVTQLGAAVPST